VDEGAGGDGGDEPRAQVGHWGTDPVALGDHDAGIGEADALWLAGAVFQVREHLLDDGTSPFGVWFLSPDTAAAM
jgi:hypothetical protein